MKLLPLLYEHFKKNNVDDFHYFTYTWLKCLFTFNFDEKLGENIFKIFILKNDFNVYFYIILAIYKCYEQKLLSINNNLNIIGDWDWDWAQSSILNPHIF